MERFKGIIIFLAMAICTSHVFAQTTPVTIDFYSNGNKLNAEFYRVSEKTLHPTLILLHGYPGGEGDPLGLAGRLSAMGINVFVFNYQGTWSSEGTFSFDSSMEDVGNAVSFLKESVTMEGFGIDTSNMVVAGYSFGGAMALTEAIYNPEINRVVSIGGADEAVFGRKMLTDSSSRAFFESMLRDTQYPEGPVKFDLDEQMAYWFSNLDRYDLVKHAESLSNRDILLIGGWDDPSCIVEDFLIPLYRRLKELGAPSIDIEVYQTDHSFRNVREEMSDRIFIWIMGMN